MACALPPAMEPPAMEGSRECHPYHSEQIHLKTETPDQTHVDDQALAFAIAGIDERPQDATSRQSTSPPLKHEESHDSVLVPELQHEEYPLWRRCKVLWQQVYDYLQDSWALEIAACATAATLFGAELITLSFFDGRAVDSWPRFWSLNSAVAFITTVIESLLYFAVSSAIGQMKWLWFRSEENKLIWIDWLARSKTPVGALSVLLLHTKIWK